MYVYRLGCEWVFIPRDDIEPRPSQATVTTSGHYHIAVMNDTSGRPAIRAVASMGPRDPARDRMVLDNIGAREAGDPPGSPWVAYACREGSDIECSPSTIAGVLYEELSGRRSPPREKSSVKRT